MSTTFARYPTLVEAFRMLAADNGMSLVDNIQEVKVPADWTQRIEDAEEQASRLRSDSLDTYLDETQLGEEAEGDENALEYMCTGEEGIVDILIETTDTQVLHEVLNAAFEGELHSSIYD